MCVCVCTTTADADSSGSICYRYEGVGDQAQGASKKVGVNRPTTCALCAARVAREPLTRSKGVYQPWGNRRLSTGYSLYMGLGDLFIEILI